jgi:hypothetical protein
MQIIRSSSDTQKGPAEWLTGDVHRLAHRHS